MNIISKKIAALRMALEALEYGVHYEHGQYGSCNCGIVACALTNMTASDIDSAFQNNPMYIYELDNYSSKYFYLVVESCSVTGTPINVIIKKLKENGFTVQDLKELELLSNENYGGCKDNPRMDDRDALVQYLEHWIAALEKSQQPLYEDTTRELAVFPVEEKADQPVKEIV